MDANTIVSDFIAAIVARDLDTAVELLADDVLYDNVPMDDVHGRDGVRAALGPFVESCTEIDWVVHRQVAAGDVVMNARTDRFQLGERWIEVPVAGWFEVSDGRITLWRDYFDEATFRDQMPGS